MNKIKVLISVILLFFISGNMISQDNPDEEKFYFKNVKSDIGVDSENASSHFLGDEIAVKLLKLKKTYTYKQAATPTDPVEKTVVEKPIIYNALKKMSRYYKKQVRKDKMTKAEAAEQYDHLLEIGLCVFSQDTDKFEQAIREARKAEKIEKVFMKVVLE